MKMVAYYTALCIYNYSIFTYFYCLHSIQFSFDRESICLNVVVIYQQYILYILLDIFGINYAVIITCHH